MKLRKILSILSIFVLILCGCSKESVVMPTKLYASSNQVQLIINSERNLNDIITLRFEPKETTNKDVVWSSEINDIFTLTGSTIKVNKVGSAKVTATSVADNKLSTDVTINVCDPSIITHFVTVNESDSYNITGLQKEYVVGSEVVFTINITDSSKAIDEVKMNNDVLKAYSENTYKFDMPDTDVDISITLKEFKFATSVTLTPDVMEIYVGKQDEIIIANVVPSDTSDVATWSISEGNEFIDITSNGNEVIVHAIKEGTAKVQVSYNDNVNATCIVEVKEQTGSIDEEQILAKYDIKFDLGTRITAKKLNTIEEVFDTFVLDEQYDGIINSISQMDMIYGGGYGGKSETAWYAGDMLKFGTTSVNGSLTFDLNSEVNRIKITGYVSDSSSKIQVGDASSTDWSDETNDNKTTIVTCSEMNETIKDVVEANQTTTITIDFASTKNLKIATTNKKPLYITSIEFIMAPND